MIAYGYNQGHGTVKPGQTLTGLNAPEGVRYRQTVYDYYLQYLNCLAAQTNAGEYNSECGQKIADFAIAQAQAHKPYTSGAFGPDAFDCSGLAYAAMHAAGITDIRRLADEEAKIAHYKAGTAMYPDGEIKEVALPGPAGPPGSPLNSTPENKNYRSSLNLRPPNISNLKPGDIVFFRGAGTATSDYWNATNGIAHVGVYVGKGKYGINTEVEAMGTGYGVVEADLSKAKTYKGAIRVCATGVSNTNTGQAPDLSSLSFDDSRARNLGKWVPLIKAYGQRHYHQAFEDGKITPTMIVLHYTAGKGFPDNLADDWTALGETPGLASHYVIQNETMYRLLPESQTQTVMPPGAVGVNDVSVNIEIVGANATDLAARTSELKTAATLTAALMKEFNIPLSRVVSHQQVGTKTGVTWTDYVDNSKYGKSDPGANNMTTIKQKMKDMYGIK